MEICVLSSSWGGCGKRLDSLNADGHDTSIHDLGNSLVQFNVFNSKTQTNISSNRVHIQCSNSNSIIQIHHHTKSISHHSNKVRIHNPTIHNSTTLVTGTQGKVLWLMSVQFKTSIICVPWSIKEHHVCL